jgi:hypothetical protein
MKPLWIVALAVALTQADAQQPSARLDVKTAKTGKLLNRLWESDYGSYERDHFRTTFLDVQISTVGRVPFDAVLEVVFHGKHPATKEQLVASWQTTKVRVEPNNTKRFIVSSGLVKSNTTRYAALGRFYGSGTNIRAWAARLKLDDKVIAEANSGTPLDFNQVPHMVAKSIKQQILTSDKPDETTIRAVNLNEAL